MGRWHTTSFDFVRPRPSVWDRLLFSGEPWEWEWSDGSITLALAA